MSQPLKATQPTASRATIGSVGRLFAVKLLFERDSYGKPCGGTEYLSPAEPQPRKHRTLTKECVLTFADVLAIQRTYSFELERLEVVFIQESAPLTTADLQLMHGELLVGNRPTEERLAMLAFLNLIES